MLTQSLAIIEWLDETHPQPPLLPPDAAGRARVRALALAIACDIHPINNLRVLNYLTGTLGATEAQKNGWYRYWCDVGLEALETQLAREKATGAFCHGGAPSIADICLVPQLANARRVDLDLAPYPTLLASRPPATRCRPSRRRRLRGSRMPSDTHAMTTVFPAWDVPTVPVAGSADRFPIYTGTPAGVGAVVAGDRLDGGIDGLGTLAIAIAIAPAVA